MTEKVREQISALADNELPLGEHELLIRRFAAERSLCIAWERYHIIGEAMRKTLSAVDTRGFADLIMASVSHAPRLAQPSGRLRYLLKAGTGLIAAGCVVVVAVIGLQRDHVRTNVASTPSGIVPAATLNESRPSRYGVVRNATWNGNTPDVRAELSNYMINHSAIAAAVSHQGMMPVFYITEYAMGGRMDTPARSAARYRRLHKR